MEMLNKIAGKANSDNAHNPTHDPINEFLWPKPKIIHYSILLLYRLSRISPILRQLFISRDTDSDDI